MPSPPAPPARRRLRLHLCALLITLVLPTALAGAASPPAVEAGAPRGEVSQRLAAAERADLREDTADALVAGALFVLGLAAVGLSAARKDSTTRSFLWLGLFCVLYSVRLLADTDILLLLAGLPSEPAAYLTALLTYVLPLPMYLFVEEWLGAGWGSSLLWMRRLQTVYAVGAIVVDLRYGAETAMPLNNPLVLAALGVLIVNSLHRAMRRTAAVRPLLERQEMRVLLAGIVIACGLALNENLTGAGLVPWRQSYEPLGLLAFVAALGTVVARRFVGNERRLVVLAQEMETARRIQAAILPRQLPEVVGLALAARYQPMASVGGDFYDFLPVDRHRVGLLIADVSGHGVPAALVASMVKIALAAQAEQAAEPAALLAGMNRILCGKLERTFVTAAYVFLDTAAGTATYANAGHPPLLRWKAAERAVEEVRLDALPLGRFKQAAYQETAVAIAPGDRLLLVTDGVIEGASPAGEAFGDSRLQGLLAGAAELAADRLLDHLLDRLATWCGRAPGAPLDDDVTVLAVAVEPPYVRLASSSAQRA